MVSVKTGRSEFVYEYQYKDHLGNLRVSFREGNQFTYRATMETANSAVESKQWERVNDVTINADNSCTSANYTCRSSELSCTGSYAAKLTKDKPLGPWRNMYAGKGDKIKFSARPAYKSQSNSSTIALAAYVSSLAAAIPAGATSAEKVRKQGWQSLSLTLSMIPGFTPTSNQINAYIELIVFDRNWNYIGSQRKIVSKSSLNNCGDLLEISYQMPMGMYRQLQSMKVLQKVCGLMILNLLRKKT